jgi:hypothetical protein
MHEVLLFYLTYPAVKYRVKDETHHVQLNHSCFIRCRCWNTQS